MSQDELTAEVVDPQGAQRKGLDQLKADLDQLLGGKPRWKTQSHFDDVRDCHTKFGLLVGEGPGLLTQRKLKERVEFLLEELSELAEAGGLYLNVDSRPTFCDCKPGQGHGINCRGQPRFEVIEHGPVQQDLPLLADALVDLVYVALGTANMLGLPWQELWDDVHRANLSKVRGVTKRGHAVDLTKPPGWVGPQTERILREAGWDPEAPAAERDDEVAK